MSNGTRINVVTNTVEILNANRRIDIVAPNTGTTIAVTQPTTRVVQVNVPGPQGVQGQAGNATDITALNEFTGSIQTQVNSLTVATSSYVLNAVTSSMLQPYLLSNATASMLQPYLLSNATASMLQPYVLNVQTSSFVTNAQTSSMLRPYVLSNSTSSFVTNAQTSSMLQPYVLSASTGSFITNAVTASMTVLSSSFANTASYVDPLFISASAAASGFGNAGVGAESDPVFVAKSASLATTGSNVFNGNQYIIGSVTASILKGDTEGTASWARNALTASAVDTLNQNVTILGNLSVFGTASYTFVTASQLNVGTSWISVNVAEPAERFGGLRIYDSGSLSHLATASFAWDSLNNRFVYQNASGSTYSGGMFISGPRNTGSLGDEPSLTRWFVTRGDGGDHINSTQIFSSGSVHKITGSLSVVQTNGSASITTDVNGGAYLYEAGDIVSGINAVSVDSAAWTLRSNGVTKVNWRNNRLQLTDSIYAVDWGTQQLFGSDGIGGSNTTLDWTNRYLYNGSVIAVNWANGTLRDQSDNVSLDWQQQRVYNSTSTSIDWGLRAAYDSSSVTSVNWNDRQLKDSSDAISIDWQSRTLNNSIKWDDITFYPVDDDTVDLGVSPTNRFRRAYFSRDVIADGNFVGYLMGTASWADNAVLTVSSSVTTVERGGASPAYMVAVAGVDAAPRHEQLLAYQSVFYSSSFGVERLHAQSMVAPAGFTGSLEGTSSWARNAVTASFAPNYVLNSTTASMLQPYVLTSVTASMLQPYVLTSVTSSMSVATASYVNPTFISASAAAAGFGSGGGGTSTPGTNLGLVYVVSLGYLMP